MAWFGAVNAGMTRINGDLTMKVARLKRRLALYENPSTPLSQESARLKGERSKGGSLQKIWLL